MKKLFIYLGVLLLIFGCSSKSKFVSDIVIQEFGIRIGSGKNLAIENLKEKKLDVVVDTYQREKISVVDIANHTKDSVSELNFFLGGDGSVEQIIGNVNKKKLDRLVSRIEGETIFKKQANDARTLYEFDDLVIEYSKLSDNWLVSISKNKKNED
jgi:hypothetical protein